MTVEKALQMLPGVWRVHKGGYRRIIGTRVPPLAESAGSIISFVGTPSVINAFISLLGAVLACAHRGPYHTKES